MRSLNKIAKSKGTDKSSEIHNYCEKYEKGLNIRTDIESINFLNGITILTKR